VANPLKIVCIGEAMIELAFEGTTPLVNFAGDTLNTAVYLRRNLASSSSVSFLSVLGKDPFSQRMLDFISAQGVLTNVTAQHASLLPGLYAIDTAKDGERSFLYWRENSAARTLFSDGFDVLDDFGVVYFSAITLAILPPSVRDGFLEWLSNNDKVVVFDSNYRPKLWEDESAARFYVEAAWRLTDIGLPSVDDEMALFSDKTEQDVISRLADWGVHQGGLKRGARGPRTLGASVGGCTTYEAATSVIDTTAAGDSFNGAFLGRFLQDGNSSQALVDGHKCSLKVIAHKGAITPTS
jgi:2-dehydro-3-deoxygluconokinase